MNYSFFRILQVISERRGDNPRADRKREIVNCLRLHHLDCQLRDVSRRDIGYVGGDLRAHRYEHRLRRRVDLLTSADIRLSIVYDIESVIRERLAIGRHPIRVARGAHRDYRKIVVEASGTRRVVSGAVKIENRCPRYVNAIGIDLIRCRLFPAVLL